MCRGTLFTRTADIKIEHYFSKQKKKNEKIKLNVKYKRVLI